MNSMEPIQSQDLGQVVKIEKEQNPIDQLNNVISDVNGGLYDLFQTVNEEERLIEVTITPHGQASGGKDD